MIREETEERALSERFAFQEIILHRAHGDASIQWPQCLNVVRKLKLTLKGGTVSGTEERTKREKGVPELKKNIMEC